MGPMILGCCKPWETLEHGHRSSDVLTCQGEVWEGSIVFDDSLVHIAGHGACTPIVSTVLNLLLELYVLLLKLELWILELLVPCP